MGFESQLIYSGLTLSSVLRDHFLRCSGDHTQCQKLNQASFKQTSKYSIFCTISPALKVNCKEKDSFGDLAVATATAI